MARLEEAGWVRRQTCPTDRRGSFAVLTDTGFHMLEAAAPAHVEGVRRHLFDQLSEEQVAQLGEISQVIIDGLRGERDTRPPRRGRRRAGLPGSGLTRGVAPAARLVRRA